MGHCINHATYPENVDRKKVQQEWDSAARIAGRQEGCSGLSQNIRWLTEIICDTMDEAEEYLSREDSGWYDQLAVRFRQADYRDKAIMEASQKITEARNKYREAENTLYFKDAKAEFIGCKACGSKLARKHLKSNYCPLCRADLRPETAKKTMQKLAAKIKDLEKKMEEAVKKASKKGKIMWLVKTEYHE